MNLSDVGDVWDVAEFRTGLLAGSVGATVLLAGGLLARWAHRGRPLALGGLSVAAAALWSFSRGQPLPALVVVAVAGIAVTVGATDLLGTSPWFGVALAAPFAWILGFHGGLTETGWVQASVAVVASVGAVLVVRFDDEWRVEALGPSLLAVTAAGVYVTVPDVEGAIALLGAALPLAVLGWPLRLARLGGAGASAVVATLAWTAAWGGKGRLPSVVGAMTCLGLMAGLPLGRILLPRGAAAMARFPPRMVVIAVLVAHIGVVLVAARVGGIRDDLPATVLICGVTAVVAVLVGIALRPVARDGAP